MQCHEVRDLLSAFHDGELPPEQAAAVWAHLAECPACAAELESFQKLSKLAERLDQPRPPRDVWPQIASQLDTQPARSTVSPPTRAFGKKTLAAAALLLIGLGWFGYERWTHHQHDQLTANFGRFLDTFGDSPDEAQRALLASYSGQSVEMAQAIHELKYRPVVADGLPPDYELTQAYLLKMPCCRCLQACYHRKDGSMLCVFEHDDDQSAWFGHRPTSSQVCSGKPTRLVKVDDHVAATWCHQQRYVTVIGARDMEEVTRLITYLDQHRGP